MIIWKCKQRYGACRQAVKTSDCGSDMHGFESHQAPHLFNLHSMNINDKDLKCSTVEIDSSKPFLVKFKELFFTLFCIAILLIAAFLAVSRDSVSLHVNSYFNALKIHNIQKTSIKMKQKGPDFGPYMRNLQNNIKANWNPPTYNESKHVMLLFTVAKNGDLLHHKVLNSSGDSQMDNAAIEPLLKTAPFEPLPEDYNGKSIDIQFTFDYNVFKNKAK